MFPACAKVIDKKIRPMEESASKENMILSNEIQNLKLHLFLLKKDTILFRCLNRMTYCDARWNKIQNLKLHLYLLKESMTHERHEIPRWFVVTFFWRTMMGGPPPELLIILLNKKLGMYKDIYKAGI